MYRTVRRRNGKTVRIPVDEDGYVPFDALLERNAKRSPRARAMDAKQVSKKVHSPLITPEEAVSWFVNPGRSDIYGVDARRVEPKAPERRTLGYRVRKRPSEAPELLPLHLGGFHYFGDWYEALGDANFVERDPWRNYWYMVDARQGDHYCRVYFSIPERYFLSDRGPKSNPNFGWGQFLDQFEWLPRERWADRPKGYALNYSPRGAGRRG